MSLPLSVCILDYGSGNVGSVFHIFSTITEHVVVSNDPTHLTSATHLVLPGVGAYGASMEKIKKNIPLSTLHHEVFDTKKPFLGICVGMQVLAEKGFEFGEHAGLGWIPGIVDKIHCESLPLPHVGWNNIQIKKPTALTDRFESDQDFYFVHSYVFRPQIAEDIVATAEYGEEFCAIVAQDNIYGVQFHPEKSQKAGKALLENFLAIGREL